MAQEYFSHESAFIDEGCKIGKGTKIWHFSHIMSDCVLGENCNIGQNVVISPGVVLGKNVKVQNNVSIYTGVTCDDDVFLGPSMDRKLARKPGESAELITYVKDRAGHDLRYAIDATKLQKDLNWFPSVTFEQGIEITIDWYLQNKDWLEKVTSGDYRGYYERQYSLR